MYSMGRCRAFVPPKMATSPILENLGRLRFAGGRVKTGSAHLDDLVLDHRSDSGAEDVRSPPLRREAAHASMLSNSISSASDHSRRGPDQRGLTLTYKADILLP